MKTATKFAIGSQFSYQGEIHTVEGFAGGVVVMRSSKGQLIREGLRKVMSANSFELLAPADSDSLATDFLEGIPRQAVDKAKGVEGHLLEAMTGFRSGNQADPRPNEPRQGYDPVATTMRERFIAKSEELGIKDRTLWRYKKSYELRGLYGLIDARQAKMKTAGIDERLRAAINAVVAALEEKSNTSMQRIRRLTERELKKLYPDEEIALPPESTFNRKLREITKGKGLFGSAKTRRGAANGPNRPYSQFQAIRPGQMILIDSTPLDVFAMDPYSFQWVAVQLTIALDLFTRSIVAWRFTPVSTKAVDAALLLYDIIRPKLAGAHWSEEALFAYVGVPESIVIEVGDDAPGAPLAGIPFLHPESVIVDRGRVFISQTFLLACRRLGVNPFIARPYTPTDKAHVERMFLTIRKSFLENLDGYKGPDVWSRGKDVEKDAYWFIDEIDEKFAEWVATYWQKNHHDGLSLPNVPDLHVSPNNMYEEGIARAGFVYVVPNVNLYYELLPTVWRTIQQYGVELRNLRYDADILNDFRDQQSPYLQENGKWPFRYDSRDRSIAFFFDPTLNKWHELHWTGRTQEHRPFNEMTVSYAKALVLKNGGNPSNHDEMVRSLHTLLNRLDDQQIVGRRERRLAAVNMMENVAAANDRPVRQHDPYTDDRTAPLQPTGDLDAWDPAEAVGDSPGAGTAGENEASPTAFNLVSDTEEREDDDDDLDI